MPIVSNELILTYSINSGSAGNSQASGPATSLGGYISTSAITDNTINNLFPDITGDQNAGYQVDYRCVFLKNTNGSGLALQASVLWVTGQVAGGANVLIGVDPTPASALGSSSPQAVTIGTANTSLSAAVTAGASTISTLATVPVNNSVTIDTAANIETRTVTAVSGTGPYTLTLATALGLSHNSGAVVSTQAPTGVSFPYSGTPPNQAPTAVSKATGISLGTIPAGSCKAFWYQRLAENSSALNNDNISVRIEGDSAA
jgi:hypothetical protein